MREISPSRPTAAAAPNPRAPCQQPEPAPTDAETRHLHRIAVETGPQPVFVTIGRHESGDEEDVDPSEGATGRGTAHPAIPGGFAKLFNRVIDSGAWASLAEAARAVYPPLARFAEGRDGFRVRIGLAALMKYTGLSRSSVKRGLRGLLEARLIALVRAGGVAPDGTNRTNVYQLLVPEAEAANPQPQHRARGNSSEAGNRSNASVQSAARAKRGRLAPANPATMAERPVGNDAGPPDPADISASPLRPLFSIDSWSEEVSCPGSVADPHPVPARPPVPRIAEPPALPPVIPGAGQSPNPAPGRAAARTRIEREPLHRSLSSAATTEHAADFEAAAEVACAAEAEQLPRQVAGDESVAAGAADPALARQLRELLRSWGVDSGVAAQLARGHSADQIRAAVAMARQAKARGKLRNPAGFIVRCLEESWAPASSEAGAHQRARDGQPQAARRQEEALAVAARDAADAQIDELDEQTLSLLASRVLQVHAQRPAMLRLLGARPPRESRLMRAEIAALLQVEAR